MDKISSRIFLRFTSRFSLPTVKNNLNFRKYATLKGSVVTWKSQPWWKRAVLLSFVPAVHAAWGFGGSKKEATEEKSSSQEEEKRKLSLHEKVIQDADELYSHNRFDELYAYLLSYKDMQNADILWRLARASCDKGKMSNDKEVKKKLMYDAYEYIKQALQTGDDNFAVHKWYAILLDYIGEYEGTKQRISNAYLVKEHFMRAIELKPTDATSIHLLGYWCFVFADLPWYQKKVASVVFATPPSSSYDEALKYFLEAERIDPNFYSLNLLSIGKTYLRMSNTDLAKMYLIRARDYPVITADDKQAHSEATELLKGLGVK